MFKFSNICTGLCRATIPFNILFPTSGDSLDAELQRKRMILDSMHEDGWKPNDRQAVNMDARAEKNNRSNPQTYQDQLEVRVRESRTQERKTEKSPFHWVLLYSLYQYCRVFIFPPPSPVFFRHSSSPPTLPPSRKSILWFAMIASTYDKEDAGKITCATAISDLDVWPHFFQIVQALEKICHEQLENIHSNLQLRKMFEVRPNDNSHTGAHSTYREMCHMQPKSMDQSGVSWINQVRIQQNGMK